MLSLIQTISDVNDNSSASGLPCENIVGEIVPLENFTYDNSLMSCLIMNNIQNINFTGRSVWFRIVCIEMLTSSLQGQLTFNEQGDRYMARGEGVLKQFRRLRQIQVGIYYDALTYLQRHNTMHTVIGIDRNKRHIFIITACL